MKGIADTGFLVAFANANDRHHRWAAQIAAGLAEPLLTCEAVIAETAFHLASSAVALAMINEGLVTLAFDCREHLVHLERLAARYADQKPDFAALCLVRMSELFPRHSVITTDRADFQVFRRNKRERIPILSPPER
ncbi:MAG: PIN domain-containing protein [Gammaproteobacteria bacterium]|nr:PIN domain-containing protein [Gammaproteobacteria bacterium]